MDRNMIKINYKDTFGRELKFMKKNAAQREFKKLKGQIANIEDIIKLLRQEL